LTETDSIAALRAQHAGWVLSCDWENAAVSCERSLATAGHSPEAFELLGDYRFREAFQQRTRTDFRRTIEGARAAYAQVPREERCIAREAFCRYWASDDPEERRAVLFAECLPGARKSAARHSEFPDGRGSADADRELLEYLAEGDCASSDREQAEEITREVVRLGKRALDRLSDDSDYEVAVPLASTLVLMLCSCFGINLTPEQRDELWPRLVAEADRLGSVTDSLRSPRTRSLAHEIRGWVSYESNHDYVASAESFEKALTAARVSRDCLLVGRQSVFALIAMAWQYETSDDEVRRQAILEQAGPYAATAIDQLKIPLCGRDLSLAYYWAVGYLKEIAKSGHPRPSKLEVLDRARILGKEGSMYGSFIPGNAVAQSLGEVAVVELDVMADPPRRRAILTDAIDPLRDLVRRQDRLSGSDKWNLGCYLGTLGTLELRLAQETDEADKAREWLQESRSHLTRSVDLLSHSPTLPGHQNTPAEQSEQLANVFVAMGDLSHSSEDSRSAIRALEDAISFYSELKMYRFMATLSSRLAELYRRVGDSKAEEAARARAQGFAEASRVPDSPHPS
jgi:tetratricopeptide (TPR) repeat protein